MKAVIIVVGTEILRGLIQDTNSHWLAKKLTELGFEVSRIIAVPDSYDDIAWAITSSLQVADLIIITGGLGFTDDDITVPAMARALGLELVLSQEAVDMIRRRVGSEPTYQLKAAYLPVGSIPLYNAVGVSPGVYVRVNGKHLFLLPGVPAEMKSIFETEVQPRLSTIVQKPCTRSITVITDHERETMVDTLLKPLREKYRDAYFKTHATTPVKISVIISSSSKNELEELSRKILEDLAKHIRIREVQCT